MWENFTVKIADQTTLVKPFPISIAFTLKDFNQNGEVRQNASELLKNYGVKSKLMGIGVDRIDYTKGIIERFLGAGSRLWARDRLVRHLPLNFGGALGRHESEASHERLQVELLEAWMDRHVGGPGAGAPAAGGQRNGDRDH